MSRVLTEVELKQAIANEDFIVGGKDSSVEGLKYDFTLGSRMLFGHQSPIDASKLSEREAAELVVRPGELVYVLSEERLNLPNDIKAELSPKRKVSHLGIMVLGGFCVDPGYKGHLAFALYNLATMPFPLQIGRKLIAAQFYRLDPDEVPPPTKSDPIDAFPGDLVQLMQAYEPATVMGIQTAVTDLAAKLGELSRQVQTKEEWFDRFQKSLEGVTANVGVLTQNVDKLREGMKEEVEARKNLGKDVVDLRTQTAVNGTRLTVTILLGGAVVGAVVGTVVELVLTHVHFH